MFSDVKHAALVLSKEAHAKILSTDASEALALPGVLTYVDAKVRISLTSQFVPEGSRLLMVPGHSRQGLQLPWPEARQLPQGQHACVC